MLECENGQCKLQMVTAILGTSAVGVGCCAGQYSLFCASQYFDILGEYHNIPDVLELNLLRIQIANAKGSSYVLTQLIYDVVEADCCIVIIR